MWLANSPVTVIGEAERNTSLCGHLLDSDSLSVQPVGGAVGLPVKMYVLGFLPAHALIP